MIKIYLFSLFLTIYSSYCFASAKDNIISKSNLSEYKNGYTILSDNMKSISVKKVLDFLNNKKLTDK